ncbi:hypothetical protein [Georgenia wangjunii]|uniref:hypothetical protein n=1 Tax=Georgenia wangjunii TaxID=3117730 RepID=UPI002F266C9B
MGVRAVVAAGLVLLGAAGCSGAGGPPGGDPETTGVVRTRDGGAFLVESSDGYFEGMSLLGGDPLIYRGSDGAEIGAVGLEEGATVEVWIGGPCAESYPVQCDIEAVRVLDR